MTTDFYPTKNHLDVPVSGAIRNSEMSKSEFETQAVVQLQAHLATQERRIKCGQRFALTHNLFPLVPVVTPQNHKPFLYFKRFTKKLLR